MNNRFFTVMVIVVVAVFLAVFVVVQQNNTAMIERVAGQQSQMMAMHQKYAADGESEDDIEELFSKQRELENRLTALEQDIRPVIAMLKNVQAGAQQPRPAPPTDEYTKVHQIDMGQSPFRGEQNAPVTLVEFVDFQCPFCTRAHPLTKEVLNAYPGKVRYVLKNYPLPFHPQAKPAAKATLAAKEQGKYWEMVDAILENSGALSDQKYEEFAQNIGLDLNRFKADLKDKDAEFEKTIQADMDMVPKVEVRGTPTFYLNGRKTMARDLSAFKREIDEILNKK